jgi:uncharacterized protein (TIGR02145 family)
VTFKDHDGVTLKTQAVDHGRSAVPPPDPVREGYHFTGWDVPFATVTSELEVTARYAVNQYTIHFDSNGGTAVADITQDYGTPVMPTATPVREGYGFGGWNPPLPDVMPANDMTVTAVWHADQYSVTFRDHHGTVLKTQVVAYGNSAAAPADPSREGHTFAGWDVPYGNITSDLVVTARYTVNQYTISFDSSGGTAVPAVTREYGTAVNPPPEPSREGYLFAGWQPALPAVMPGQNLTLTALWSIRQYTVTFRDHDGKVLKSELVDHGNGATAPPDPGGEGRRFIGWDMSFDTVTANLVVRALYSGPMKIEPVAPCEPVDASETVFVWKQAPAATWYMLFVQANEGEYKFSQWYEIQDDSPGFPDADCSGTECTVSLDHTLETGTYTWWVKGWNQYGDGEWSDGMAFIVFAEAAPPGKIVPTAPSGQVDGKNMTFDWQADDTATWYKLFVQDNADRDNKYVQWYEIENNSDRYPEADCSGGICSVSLDMTFDTGSYTWWVLGWNNHGSGEWSYGMPFTVHREAVTPLKIELVSPSGRINGTEPAFAWKADENATWYKIFIQRQGHSYKFTQWYELEDHSAKYPETACSGDTCVVILDESLEEGDYTWWVMGWNDLGNGEWSDGMNFVVEDAIFLTDEAPDYTVAAGSQARIYGSDASNTITLGRGAKAVMVEFPGHNAVVIQSGDNWFTVSRSGMVVTMNGPDGTVLKLPASTSVQTISFPNRTLTLTVFDGRVMLDNYVITETPVNVITQEGVCGAWVSPDNWKQFDCYNLAAIGRTTNDDPFSPSWRLIGGYWPWGRKGPAPDQWHDTNTPNFAHGPVGPGAGETNSGSIPGWNQTGVTGGAWSDSRKTANDPCPEGFRVPNRSHWQGVLANNEQRTTGTWNQDDTNYSSALFLGNDLMLPAAGYRYFSTGSLYHRGYFGYYWTTTEGSTGQAWRLGFGTSGAGLNTLQFSRGFSVRCVVE